MKKLLLLMMVVTLCACHEDEKEYFIDPLLETYYESFIHEGDIRGVTIIRENLVMKVVSGIREEYKANGVYRKKHGQRYIYIDLDWYNKRGYKVENTVFHELGHALLNRRHNSGYSLMNSNISGTDQGWPSCTDCRKTLIDELFNPAY